MLRKYEKACFHESKKNKVTDESGDYKLYWLTHIIHSERSWKNGDENKNRQENISQLESPKKKKSRTYKTKKETETDHSDKYLWKEERKICLSILSCISNTVLLL